MLIPMEFIQVFIEVGSHWFKSVHRKEWDHKLDQSSGLPPP